MLRYLIERDIPGAGDLTADQLTGLARTFNAVTDSLGVPYRWVTSYAAGDKVWCLHEAEDVEAVMEHVRRAGYPADRVSVVAHEFGPHNAASATPVT